MEKKIAVFETIETITEKETTIETEPPIKEDTTAAFESLSLPCLHKNQNVKDEYGATCVLSGYTGDVYCANCKIIIAYGSQIPPRGHRNTQIRGYIAATETTEGYTGDTYCADCSAKISSGQKIAKLESKDEYILPDGTHIFVDKSITDVTGYFMAMKTKRAEHLYPDIENEILSLCNVQREKAGLVPLEWFEDAYCFTRIRAEECLISFSHTRPNKKSWSTVYYDEGIVISGGCAENLYATNDLALESVVRSAVNGWMESQGHRTNILNPDYARISITVIKSENRIIIVQNFFG